MKYFVVGTDTGIGKTVVSTLLVYGLGAHYWKPIQTGSSEGTDSSFVSRWIGRERVLPETYIFPLAASPHLAAADRGDEISLETCLQQARETPKTVIAEGAGGVLVPINSQFLLVDLLKALEWPVIVVASTRLGTINHTLLTLESLRARQISIAGLITVGEENRPVHKTLVDFGRVESLAHIPYCYAFSETWFEKIYDSQLAGKLC